jgi:hypothetical protein
MDYKVVRDYVYENKNTNVDYVSRETGVSKQTILFLLKEGWLTLDESTGGNFLMCEVCKKPIATSRFCDKCKDSVSSAMQKSIEKEEPVKPKDDRKHGVAKLKTKK